MCLFLNAPIINAQAKTRKSYVFTISEFEKEANKIAKNIENDTSVIPFVDECEVFVFESEKDFIDKWNSIEEAEQIIIDCHGCRSVIGTEGPEINAGLTNLFSSDIHFRTFGNWYLIQESGYKKLGKKCYSIIELVHIN